MWVFKSKASGNYVKHRNYAIGASYLFTTDVNKALMFSTVNNALTALQQGALDNANDCWKDDRLPVITQCISGYLTLCEVEEYTPPKKMEWREKRVL